MTETVKCACQKCNCQTTPQTGYVHEGQLYCSQTCAYECTATTCVGTKPGGTKPNTSRFRSPNDPRPTNFTSLAFALLATGLLVWIFLAPFVLPDLFRGQLSMVPLFCGSLLASAACAVIGVVVALAKGIHRRWANALGFAISVGILLLMCIMRAIH